MLCDIRALTSDAYASHHVCCPHCHNDCLRVRQDHRPHIGRKCTGESRLESAEHRRAPRPRRPIDPPSATCRSRLCCRRTATISCSRRVAGVEQGIDVVHAHPARHRARRAARRVRWPRLEQRRSRARTSRAARRTSSTATPGRQRGQPAALADSLVLGHGASGQPGTRYPGRHRHLARRSRRSTSRRTSRLARGRGPRDAARGAATRDRAYPVRRRGRARTVACTCRRGAGRRVSVFAPTRGGRLTRDGRIEVGRHPSALLLERDGTAALRRVGSTDRVAVVDTRARSVIARLLDPPPAGPTEGSTPNALALSPDGTRLFVAEADNNAVAVFDLSAATSGVATARGTDQLAGRMPGAVVPDRRGRRRGDSLWVVNGKGRGAGPNPTGPAARVAAARKGPRGYTLGQLDGTHRPCSRRRARRGARRASPRASPTRTAGRAATGARAAVSAVRARDLHHQGEPHLRSGLRRSAAGRRRHVAGVLPARGLAEPSRAGRAVRALRPLLRQRRGERAGPQLVHGGYVTDYVEKTTPDVVPVASGHDRRTIAGDVDDAGRPASSGTRRSGRACSLRNYGECAEPVPRATRPERAGVSRDKRVRCGRTRSPTYPAVRHGDPRSASRRRLDRRVPRARAVGADAGARDRCICRTITRRARGAESPTPQGVHGGQRSRARPHRRGAVALAVLEDHRRVRARGRRAGRARSRRLASVACCS